jgi:hypothetical protein
MPAPSSAGFTYDTSTAAGRVRLLIPDNDEVNFVFDDLEIDTFLALEGEDVRLAAAQALETIASNSALVLKVIRTQDLQTDGAKLSAELRDRAKGLRAQVAGGATDGDDPNDGFAVVGGIGGRRWPELTERPYC